MEHDQTMREAIKITSVKEKGTKTYLFKVELEEENGVWGAVVPALPGCNALGSTKEEVLEAIQENIHIYLELLLEKGQVMTIDPDKIQVFDEPMVAVTV
jgi:predicted RNase H-like HicB family nuclease